MTSLKKKISTVLAVLSVVALMVVLLVWAYVFFNQPELAEQWKKALLPVGELVGLSVITAFLRKRFKAYLRETKSLSRSLTLLIGGEWILQAAIWGAVVITFIHLSYQLPVHRVRFLVTQPPGSTAVPIDRVMIHSGDLAPGYPLTSSEDDPQLFVSPRCLTWNDSASIAVESPVLTEPQVFPVVWSGVAPLAIFRGVKLSLPLSRGRRSVTIQTIPSAVQSEILVSHPLDTEFARIGTIVIEKGEYVTVRVMAEGYLERDTTITNLTANDTATIELVPLPAYVTFCTITEGGVRKNGLSIFVDDQPRNEKSWEEMQIAPGEHSAYLEQRITDSERYVVNRFSFSVAAGQRLVDTLRVTRID
jgi:hypothetical protein